MRRLWREDTHALYGAPQTIFSSLSCRDIPHRLTVLHFKERVGIHQKLKIGFYFCERKALERRISSQHWNKLAWLCFERHRRINACFASRHTHDFKDRFAVELVV